METEDYYKVMSFGKVKVLGLSEEEAAEFAAEAEAGGLEVLGRQVWGGPVPEGSYTHLGGNIRMSTPEFFFFRMANQLDLATAALLGCELCGFYSTNMTTPAIAEDAQELYDTTHTTQLAIEGYLSSVGDTPYGTKALEALEYVHAGDMDPFESYVCTVAHLPVDSGGFGLPSPKLMPAPLRHGDGMVGGVCLFWDCTDAALLFSCKDGENLSVSMVDVNDVFERDVPDAGGLEETTLDDALGRVRKCLAPERPAVLDDAEWLRKREDLYGMRRKLFSAIRPYYTPETDGSTVRIARIDKLSSARAVAP